jgi:polyferredoxin
MNSTTMPANRVQRFRRLTQAGFFILFLFAPPLDIFRYDLTQSHFVLLGFDLSLGISGEPSDALHVLLYGLLPFITFVVLFIYVAWRWGRLYCGWLCPHFSVVETINGLMRRASGKPSIWEKQPLPTLQPDGHVESPDAAWWLPSIVLSIVFAFVWAVGLLTYLLPPFEIYHNLLHADLTRNQFLFITIVTILFSIDFLFARHLFCRFGCAVGLFQSLAWMTNRRAMVVSFDAGRAAACKQCNSACDNACPMRLQPRIHKRRMFTCTQCGECISACTQVQQRTGDGQTASLLDWQSGDKVISISSPPMDMYKPPGSKREGR